MKERLAHILKVLLGLVFIVSAILKIVGMDQLELYIYSFHFFSLNQSFLVARAAIILELVLGIGLVGNRLHKPIWWGSVLMLLGYTGFLVYALFLGRTDNCHCFGDVLRFNPWQSLIKNGVLLALFALIYKVNGKPLKHKALALISTVILCGAIVFVVSPPDNYTPNYESSQDLNRELFGEALRQPPMDTLNLAEGKKAFYYYFKDILCGYLAVSVNPCNLRVIPAVLILIATAVNAFLYIYFIFVRRCVLAEIGIGFPPCRNNAVTFRSVGFCDLAYVHPDVNGSFPVFIRGGYCIARVILCGYLQNNAVFKISSIRNAGLGDPCGRRVVPC